MRQGGLADKIRVGGAVGTPIFERRAKSVNREARTHFAHEHQGSLSADVRSTQAASSRFPRPTSILVPPSTTRFLLWLAATRSGPSLIAWHRARDPAHPNTAPSANRLCGRGK